QINLSWTDNSNNEEHFMVERKTGSGGTYSQIAQVGTNVTTYSDTGLSPNTTYFYMVRAHSSALGYSGYSNEASAATQGGTSISDGSFLGSYLDFKVVNNHITYLYLTPASGCLIKFETSAVSEPIVDGKFSYAYTMSGYLDLDITGTFSDNDHASGIYSYEVPGVCVGVGAWSATRQ
ncbi:MAG: fibronectin type III domain-containing protein, partial [Nitrospirota bacterium]|nr:fibronectin type III domain-containing protein [Nitrospirota bacterium]